MTPVKGRRRARRRGVRWWRRPWASTRPLPRALLAVLALAVAGALTIAYQVLRKPTELFAVVPTSARAPGSTWAAYGALFREYSTDLITPELLAALAQVESAGDPFARTYWRWRWSWNPLGLYGPASTAVGLFQITDGTFAEARHLRVRDHRVVRRDGPWRDPPAGVLDELHVRWLPSHAVEVTSAWLDQGLREALGKHLARATPAQRQRLAAVIHLCGQRRGAAFARRGFRALPGERCGDHDIARYVARIGDLAGDFARLAASG